MRTPHRILIVEDNPTNVKVLVVSLGKEGIETVVARDGFEAVDMATESQPDLILLDVMMPGRDGFEVCRILKSQKATAAIPIIFLTAKSTAKDLAEAFSIGASDFVSKPFRIAEVLARVAVHLQISQDQRELTHRNRQLEQMSILVAESNVELAQRSRIDPLTELLNRAAWEEAILLEQGRTSRHGSVYSIIMIDVDHFKSFNDSLGHPAGDDCLRQIAQSIQSTSRPTDAVGRYGGEEFVVLAPETDLDGALVAAERIRRAIENLNIPHLASPVSERVTISLGVSAGPAGSWEDILKKADDALYLAKKNGRNRVWLDGATPSAPQTKGPTSRATETLDGAITVLIVDDNPTNRTVLKGYVEREGYIARQAADGHAALTQVARKAPDIIFMDVMMPGMDGLECTRRLKANPETKNIPIIIVSARADSSDLVVALEAGADEYLTKPLRATEFSVRLRSVVEHLRDREQLRRGYESRSEQARSLVLALELAQLLGDTDDLDWALEQIIAATVELTGCRRVSIMLPDADQQFLYIAKAVGVDEQVIASTKVVIGESIAGRVFETHKALVVNTERDLKAERHVYDSDYFASIPLLCAVLGSPKRVVGVLSLTERTDEEGFGSREVELINLIGSVAGTAIDNILTRATRDQARNSIMLAFAKLAEHRDSETGRHVDRVTQYCLILAEELRKSEESASEIDDIFMYNLERAAPLHDIGKVAIPDHVLLKPGRLTRSEMEVMRTHAQIGAETIRDVRHRVPDFDILKMAEDIARFHHEWYDGTGYPRCLKGDAIPLSCRIIGLVDVYDALRRKRVYKDAVGHDEATTIILRSSGTQFDPSIVESFLRRENDFRRLSAELADTPKPSSDGTTVNAEPLTAPLVAAETHG